MKIVINTSYGGFGLSAEAEALLVEAEVISKVGAVITPLLCEFRSDPALVFVVEILGEKANGGYAQLKVVEIPDDVGEWYITNYDGNETIHEGRQWR